MVVALYTNSFKKSFKKIKSNDCLDKIKTQITKILENPNLGKPMRYERKGTREIYISPYRLAYTYIDNKVIFLEIYHKYLQ